MRAPRTFDFLAVHFLRPRPSFWRSQDDHGPTRTCPVAARTCFLLNLADFVNNAIQRLGHQLMHDGRVIPLDKIRLVAVADEETFQLIPADAGQHCWVGDLVTVQMQDGKHGPVYRRVEELVGMPGGRQRPGFRFSIADHTGDNQVRVVERRPKRVRQRVAQLAPLVNRTRCLRGRVARNASRKGKLFEQTPHSLFVLRHRRIEFAVRALQIRVGHNGRPAVPRTGDEDHAQVMPFDRTVQMDVHEVQAGRRAPMPQQTRLDVFRRQRLLEQRIVVEINLSDRQVVRSPPVCVHGVQLFGGE